MNHYKLLLCVHFNIYLEPFKIATEKRALRQPLMMYSVVTNEYKLHHIYSKTFNSCIASSCRNIMSQAHTWNQPTDSR